MAVSSYFFVNAIERGNLRRATIGALSFVQAKVEADMQETSMLLSTVSYTIFGMIHIGDNVESIYTYMEFISNSVMRNDDRNMKFNGICGLFHVFGDTLVCNDGRKPQAIDYDYTTRPWYQAATRADGAIAVTEPFISMRDSAYIISHTRQLKDSTGRVLAVINFDTEFASISDYVTELALAQNSYGVILNKDAAILAHPNKAMIGMNMREAGGGMAGLESELLREKKIIERELLNFANEKVIVSMRSMENGWFIGILTSKKTYYKDTRVMAAFLIILGALLATILNYILLRIAREKRKADEFMQVMFNTTPLACHVWSRERKVVTCNDEAVRMYGATDKKDFLGRFHGSQPQIQPGGEKSAELASKYLELAFAEGSARFEWLHKRHDGEPLPCVVTLIRAVYKNELVVLAYVQDLREQKAALQKMREADVRAQVMLDATPLCANFWNRDFKNIDCNQEAVRLFGLTGKSEYLARFHELSPERQPDGRLSEEKAIHLVKKAFEDGYTRFDWMHQKPDGEQIPCEITLVRVRHKDDFIVAGYTRDMREINAALNKMREADERTQAMLDATPIGITLWDKNINLVDFNYEAARVVGITSKQEYINRFQELVPEYQPDGQKSFEKMAAFVTKVFEENHANTAWHHNHLNGETIPFFASAFRLNLKYKDEDTVMVCCSDQREIIAANAKMREADERAKIMLDATPVSCTLFEAGGKVIDCNREALNLLGVPSKKEYLTDMFKYSPEFQPDGSLSKEKGEEYVRQAFDEGFVRFEWTHLSTDGELIPVEVTLVRVKLRGENAVAGYARDLRELKAMIKEMHRAEIAEEGNRAKSRFLATMSHEIRTPMNVILGVTEIQLHDEALPAQIREAFVQIYNSGDLLLGIINDILDLSKIEADRMEFSPARYDLASMVNDAAHLNMMRNSKPITFELNVDENAPVNLFGDELRIKQVLNNLLSNAFKFTDSGTVKLTVTAAHEVYDDGSGNDTTLILNVSDTGQGMTKEQVDRLFTEYTRFNLEVNRTVEGTGLGMNITRRLVGMMGGTIAVESELGKGTSVIVHLPQRRMSDECIGRELSESLRSFRIVSTAGSRARITREYMPYGKVLVVDDVESNLYVAKGLMAPYGLTVDIASSGFDAIDRVKQGEVYDIIFMDHMMPRMDGIEATGKIRMLGYKHPIIALSANAVVGQADVFLKSGFDDFISKPIDIRQLNTALNRLVRDKQAPETIKKARKDSAAALAAKAVPAVVTPELLAIFVRDANRALPLMQLAAQNIEALPESELRLFTTNVHGMKSALANIGETKLSQMANTLEKAGKAGDRHTLAKQTMEFIDALRDTVVKTEAAIKTDDAVEDENPELLKTHMGIIAKACRDYDEKKAAESLETLKSMTWTAETRGRIEKITALLLHSEFDDAADVADKMS